MFLNKVLNEILLYRWDIFRNALKEVNRRDLMKKDVEIIVVLTSTFKPQKLM